jgi:DNA-binding protein H-NS
MIWQTVPATIQTRPTHVTVTETSPAAIILSAFGIYSYIDLFLGDKQMPKPNLSAMSVDALLKLRDDINKALERKANELRSQLSMLGRPAIQRGSRLKGTKVPPKYRSPLGETWAGRGAKPRWLVAAIQRGKRLEDFLIAKRKRRRGKHR